MNILKIFQFQCKNNFVTFNYDVSQQASRLITEIIFNFLCHVHNVMRIHKNIKVFR